MKIFYNYSGDIPVSRKKRYIKSTIKCLQEYNGGAHGLQVQTNRTKPNYNASLQAIVKADAVVLDGTNPDLEIGHQFSFAHDKQKPVLLLFRKTAKGRKAQKYFQSCDSPLIWIKWYRGVADIEKALSSFLKEFSTPKKSRLNIVLERKFTEYLDWCDYKYKRGKTETIRQGLRKLMEEDSEYQEEKP